jgi:N-acetylglutamate synthase-like GNAT family acetyltransferase
MTAGEKVVSIVVRRARPADCVNIHRLLKPLLEAQPVQPDDGKAIAYVLHLIENAYVVVADLSGRVVGASVCSAYPPPSSRELLLDMEYLAAAPGFEQRGVKEALLRNVFQYARKNGAALRMALSPEESAALGENMRKTGFVLASHVFTIARSKYADDPVAEPDPDEAGPLEEGRPEDL